jgi:hypothetical protein
MDGTVDAFGMGGIDLYLYTKDKRYAFRDAKKIARAAVKTPMVDGSGLKNTLERRVIKYLDEKMNMLKGKKVLLVSGLDRFGMAEAFEEAGCITTYGDVIFALGLPVPVKSRHALDIIGKTLLPILVQLPFQLLYPTGEKQVDIDPKYTRFYDENEIIAGDFHYIRKYMPLDMKGKTVITNTVTSKNVEELRERGVKTLVTTTPELDGRSFGTNVMEATLIALSGKKPEEMTAALYNELLDKINFKPRIQELN